MLLVLVVVLLVLLLVLLVLLFVCLFVCSVLLLLIFAFKLCVVHVPFRHESNTAVACLQPTGYT